MKEIVVLFLWFFTMTSALPGAIVIGLFKVIVGVGLYDFRF